MKANKIYLFENNKVKVGDFRINLIEKYRKNIKILNLKFITKYLPPELIEHNEYSPFSDIWYLGIILF